MEGGLICRIAAVLICLMAATFVEARPRYIECVDSSECGLDSCCMLGVGRFSLPRCVSLREAYDTCRPGSQIPMNVTVSYPDGESVDLTNVYSVLCPCQPGLLCSDRTGTCEDPSMSVILNTIY